MKRPFDDQSQSRIRFESEAVLAILGCEPDVVRFVRSPALLLENSRNPIKERAARVDAWLKAQPMWHPNAGRILDRTRELIQLGFKNFDALHVASAEQSEAVFFSTCDDRLLGIAQRHSDHLHVRVVSVGELAAEVLK